MPRKPLSEETKAKISASLKGKKYSEERKEKISKALKKYFENPEARQKTSEATKQGMSNSEIRKRISVSKKGKKLSEETKRKISKASKKMWENLEIKEKISKSIKKVYNENPEIKKKLSEAIKKAWENPELREKQSNAVRKTWQNPELRRVQSEISKKMWENSDYKLKMIKNLKERWQNPEFKKKQSEASKLIMQKRAEQHRQEFIEKYNLSGEFLEKEFIENNRFDIYKFCEYCNISYHTGLKYKRHFNIEIPNVQRNCLTQQEIYDFISQHVEAGFNNRKVISPQELDIFIPSRNIAIEFDGLLYHSSGYSSLSQCNSLEEYPLYHLEKTQACMEKNVQLFHIFENEWRDKKEIWQSVLLNALGKSKRIYARKCIVKEVPSKEAKEFLNANHLQGACSSKVNIGLYSENTLVSLMTFGRPRFNKLYEWELLRFCNTLNTSVIGGASRLLNYFVKMYSPSSILSYANLRWSTGNLYEKLGFTLKGTSSPNYFYFNEDFILHSRIEFQKHKLKDKLENYNPDLTESENMYNNDYRKIYDCGNLVYGMKLKD